MQALIVDAIASSNSLSLSYSLATPPNPCDVPTPKLRAPHVTSLSSSRGRNERLASK
jgi:hypothetical protein